jgi:hypothetical protein
MPRTQTFQERKSFVQHLASEASPTEGTIHAFKDEEAEEKVAPKDNQLDGFEMSVPWMRESVRLLPAETTYLRHLRHQHGLYAKDAGPYMPTTQSNE